MINENKIEKFFEKQILNIKINHLEDKNFHEYDYITEIEKVVLKNRSKVNYLLIKTMEFFKIINATEVNAVIKNKMTNEISKTIYSSILYKELKRIIKSNNFKLTDFTLLNNEKNYSLLKYILKYNYISKAEIDIIYNKVYNFDCSHDTHDKYLRSLQEKILYKFDYSYE